MSTSEIPLSEEELNHLFTEACTAQTEGRYTDAMEKYLLLLEYFPEAPMLRYNVGLVYFSLKQYSQAMQEFALALTFQPDDGDTLFNLALCQKKTGDNLGAIVTYRKLLQAMPESTDCWYNLAGCYRDIHDEQQSVSCYHEVLLLDDKYLPAINNLAYLYHRMGETEQAEKFYRQVLLLRPEDDSARYMLASLLGMQLDHAPDSYVESFFDAYAEGFEESLVKGLGYDNPRQLLACLERCTGIKRVYDHGLDLGCGTGLSGVPFKKIVTDLKGVDLSGNMLEQAAEKGCYTALYQDSISNFLAATTETYDFFLATDVFIYVGELMEIFSQLRELARPEALFCFSTEYLGSTGYRLRETGRFAYSSDYIRNIAAVTGWTVLVQEQTRLRKEREQWLDGELWILQLTREVQ